MLQMQWDARLVHDWGRDFRMHITTGVFMAQRGITLEQFSALKRVPRHQGQFNCPVRAFVAQALPWLSERLWRGDDPSDLVLQMDGTTLDTAHQRGSRGAYATELRAAYTEIRQMKSVNQHRGQRRSDWHVCKG